MLRVESSKLRMPRSQRINLAMFPCERMYSADIRRSLTVAAIPALQEDRGPGPANLLEEVKVLHVPGANLDHVGILDDQIKLDGGPSPR